MSNTTNSTNPNKSNPADVAKIFQKFDSNGDGKISGTELASVLTALGSVAPPEEVNRMMDEMDKDGDGYVDLADFSEFYAGTGGSVGSTTELREAFDLYDKDGNGLISVSELHAVMKSLGEECSLKDCLKMILSVDSDGDGHVNFEEFVKMMAA